VARFIGIKCTAAAGLAAIGGGLWQVSAVASAATTYGTRARHAVIGLGAGLLLPHGDDSVVGASPKATPELDQLLTPVALQVGGALGVAVFGSVLSTRYQDRMTAALAGRHVPTDAVGTILGLLVALYRGRPRRWSDGRAAGAQARSAFIEREQGVAGGWRRRRAGRRLSSCSLALPSRISRPRQSRPGPWRRWVAQRRSRYAR